MTEGEFGRVWRLLGTLFPAATAKKSKNALAVWKRGLSAFAMDDISDRIMEYAQANKYFPDLADITKGLTPETVSTEDVDASLIHNVRVYARVIGVKAPAFRDGADAWAWFERVSKRRREEALDGD